MQYPLGRLVIDAICRSSFDDEFADAWDALLARSTANTVFLTAGWLRAWHETLGGEQPLVIAQVFKQGRLVAAAAFVTTSGTMEFAGAGPSDYLDIVVDAAMDADTGGQAVGALLAAARDATPGFRAFRLRRIQPESTTAGLIERSEPRFLATFTGEGDVAPFLDMGQVEDRLRKKSLNRDERRLMRQGQVSCDTMTSAADILPHLEAFFDQHVRRWLSAGIESQFLRDDMRAFYRRFVERLAASGEIRFTQLRLNGDLVASHLGFLRAGRFVLYKLTFDPTLAKLSPGKVLIKRLLELAREEGAQIFDFTIGDEAYKHWFASGVRDIRALHVTDSRAVAAIRRSRAYVGRTTRALMDRLGGGVRSPLR